MMLYPGGAFLMPSEAIGSVYATFLLTNDTRVARGYRDAVEEGLFDVFYDFLRTISNDIIKVKPIDIIL
jgi:hypothetical protein